MEWYYQIHFDFIQQEFLKGQSSVVIKLYLTFEREHPLMDSRGQILVISKRSFLKFMKFFFIFLQSLC